MNYAKHKKIDLVKIKTNTVAVNGEKLKLLGYITFNSSFDIEGKNNVKKKHGFQPKTNVSQTSWEWTLLIALQNQLIFQHQKLN